MDLASILTGTGAAALAFIGGMAKERTGREASFNSRVDKELGALRDKVAECEKERTQVAIIKIGVTMLIEDMRERDPRNPVLLAVAAAYSYLDPEPQDFAALLKKLNEDKADEPAA